MGQYEGHHTENSPMGLGQYNSLAEYCDPHTAPSVFLILVSMIESDQFYFTFVFHFAW